jgi:hypothetical protein
VIKLKKKKERKERRHSFTQKYRRKVKEKFKLESGKILSKTFLIERKDPDIKDEEPEIMRKWREFLREDGYTIQLFRQSDSRDLDKTTLISQLQDALNISEKDNPYATRLDYLISNYERDFYGYIRTEFQTLFKDFKKKLDSDSLEQLRKYEEVEYREIFEVEYVEWDIESIYGFDVLAMDKSRLYDIYFEGLISSPDTVRKNEDFKKFRVEALKYVSEQKLKSILLNAGLGMGYGFIALLINASEIILSMKLGRESVEGKEVVVGIHSKLEGSGDFEIEKGRNKTKIKLDDLMFDSGAYSLGSVFGTDLWNY